MDPIVYLAKNNNADALDMQKPPLKQLSTIEIGTRISSVIPFDRSSSDSVSHKMHYASIFVNSQFDSTTSKLFRALQKNILVINASSIDDISSKPDIPRQHI